MAGRDANVAHAVGEPILFEGFLDDFEDGVAAVQFSLDDGASWTAYETTGAVADKGLNWRFEYTPKAPGRYVLKVRAVSGAGEPSSLVTRFAFEVEPSHGA